MSSASPPRRGVFQCDFKKALHRKKLCEILASYMCDPMGDAPPHSPETFERMLNEMSEHPNLFVLFATHGAVPVGAAVCFHNYSTFAARPFVNIHDLAVLPAYRQQGIAQLLMKSVELKATLLGAKRVTLEVREDNEKAWGLYLKNDFQHCAPPMYYLRKDLSSDHL